MRAASPWLISRVHGLEGCPTVTATVLSPVRAASLLSANHQINHGNQERATAADTAAVPLAAYKRLPPHAMEFLTLQDVPHFHRSAMSFRDSSPPHHCAKPQEASERMQVGHVINPPSSPSSSLCTPTSDTHSLQTATASPSTPPSCEAPGDSRALVPVSHKPQDTPACRLYLVGNGWKAEVTAMRAMQDQAGVDALLAAAESQRAMADETLTAPAGEGQRVPAAGTVTLPLRPTTQRTEHRREPTRSPAEPERLTDIEPHPQGTANGLPPFKEVRLQLQAIGLTTDSCSWLEWQTSHTKSRV